MAIDFNKLRKKPVQEESTDIDSLIDSVFAEDNVQEPVAEVQEQPKVVQEQPKEAEQPREGGFWNTYLGDMIEKFGAGVTNMEQNALGLYGKASNLLNSKKELPIGTVGNVAKSVLGLVPGGRVFSEIVSNTGGLAKKAEAGVSNVTDNLRQKSDRYNGKNFVELWEDDKAAAVGDVFLQASESLPQSLMAAFTGPLGIASIGATVANEKYDQLDENNPNMGESQKMLNALLTGTAEAGSEYLGSVPVGKWLKGMYSKMGAKAAEEQLQKGLTGWIGTNAKKLGVLFPPVAEGVEEIASQVAENITDWATGARADLNPMEGAFESFVYGAGGGAQFSAMSLPAYGAKVVNKVKTGHDFRKASKEFSSLFEDESVDDVVAGLSSMTPEEQGRWLYGVRNSDYTDEQKKAAKQLLYTTLNRSAARSPEEYASMREEGEKMLIDSEMKRFEAASKPYIADNGRYQQVKIGEDDIFITGGTVGYKQNEFGEYVLDLDTTSEELYYVDGEGNTQITTGKAITKIVDIADYEQEYNEYLQHVTNAVKQRNQLQESISQEVTIENGDPVQYMGPDGNLIDGIAADTSLPEVITLEDGTVVPRENVIPNTQGATINPPADLQTEQPTAQTGLQTEQQTVQPVQDGTQVVEQPAPVFPVDKNNNIDYSQISEPEMYAQALQSEFDNEAVDVIDEQIQSAQARLDKASKNTDAIARRRAMKVEQAEVERLNKVKEILTPVQQNVSETAAETAGNENHPEAGQSIMSEEELSMLTEPERRLYVAENSNDPLEIADLYEQVKDETEYSEMLPWQAALLGRRVNKDSFVEHSDKNNITGAIAKSWFADKESGKKAGLDVIAAELSEYGIPVTENDIVEFILEHPGNSVKKRSKVSMTAERRFKQLIKDLTGENVGGLESNSGRLVLAGLRAGVKAEQEKQALPYDMFTIPDPIINFFEETGLNPDDFNSFEELNDAVQRELESGTFVFPLGTTDLQTINNIVQHGIKQQANYKDFASRVEKAGTQRAAQQPIFETAAGTQLEPITIEPRTEAGTESTEAGTTEQVTGEEIEYTPEDMAEIDAAIETRPLIEVIQEAAVVNEINEAEKDVDVEPTEAQKEAGNYKKGHIKLNGFDITIESPKGSQRSGTDADGKKWSIEMANSYGYIKGTKGKDNDQVDVFLGDSPLSDKVFVVDQVNKDGSFDEHKCMIGFNTIEEAESAYLANYEKGWTGLGSITEMPVDEFREWVKEGKKVEPASEEVVVEEQPQSTKTALEVVQEEAKKLDEKGSGKKTNAGVMDDFYEGIVDEEAVDNISDDGKLVLDIISVLNPGMSNTTPRKDIERLKNSVKGAGGKILTELLNEYKGDKIVADILQAEIDSRSANVTNTKEEKPNEGQFGLYSNAKMDELRKRLRDRANQLNVGIDFELMQIALELTVGYLDRGVYKINDYAKHLVEDAGDVIRPYIKSFYNMARTYPTVVELGFDKHMDDSATVDKFDVMNFDAAVENKVEKKVENPKNNTTLEQPNLFSNEDYTDKLGENSPNQIGRSESGLREGNHEGKPEGAVSDNRGKSAKGTELAEMGNSEGGRQNRNGGNSDNTSGTELHSGRDAGKSTDRPGDRGSDGKTPRVRVRKNQRNAVINPDATLAPNGDAAKFKANIAAIKLAKQLHEKGVPATKEEQEVLLKYTGWGGLSSSFKPENPNYEILKEVLTEEQFESAMNSTTTSFYTPPHIIASMWEAVKKMGFKGGSILEPSSGIGHIYGLAPQDITSVSDLTAIEYDEISGMILQALYPDAKTHISGYEEQNIKNNSLDLVITNVPFGSYKVHDKVEKDISKKFDIHDYFIAKSIRKLKPGGIGVFITTTGTMDRSKDLRNWVINEGNADFVDALRLNSDTFKANAGTEASSDIIIIRKRDGKGRSEYAKNVQDISIVRDAEYQQNTKNAWGIEVPETKKAVMRINKFFVEYPDKMAGEMKFGFEGGNAIRPTEQRCAQTKGIEQKEVIKAFINQLPKDVFSSEKTEEVQDKKNVESDGTKEGGITIIDGKPYIIEFGEAVPVDWNDSNVTSLKGGKKFTKTQVLEEYMSLKRVVGELLDAENNDKPNMEALRKDLNRIYDSFVEKFGYLSTSNKTKFLRDDVDYPSIAAIENVKDTSSSSSKTKSYEVSKSDIFSKRVIDKRTDLKADNMKDAILLSIYQNGNIDVPFISRMLGKEESAVTEEILKNRLGYVNPATGLIEDREEYLSGNVRVKLEVAQQANESGEYKANIEDLSRVVPTEVPIKLIRVSLGSSWVPVNVYEDFFKETFEVDAKVVRTSNGKYSFEIEKEGNPTDRTKGVLGAYGSTLAMNAMNNKSTIITRVDYVRGQRVVEKDPIATAQAAVKQSELNDAFDTWVKSDGNKYAKELAAIYNTTYNSVVDKKIDVSSFKHFPGASKTKTPREHQKEGTIRSLQKATLLAHEVGTGKTITLISTAMEMRRLGIAKKPVIVVQRSTYEQFVKEIVSLYPNAKVLTPAAKDLTAENRKKLLSKIAYNDWDIVVLYHGYLDSIPDSPERVNQYIDELVQEKLDLLEELESGNGIGSRGDIARLKKAIEKLEDSRPKSQSIKAIVKKENNARTGAKRLLDRKTDEVMDFEQLGIDALLIDEAHQYKKLGFVTSLSGVKGIDTAASKRAQSLRLKTSYILEQNNGKNVVLATGTPISNTMAEMWTYMRYLMPKSELQRLGINTFDSFVNNFGSIEESSEFSTSGTYKVTNRFSSYANVPELISMWKQVSHTVLTESVDSLKEGVGTPMLEGGKPTDIMIKQTPVLKSVMKGIKQKLKDFENMSGMEKKQNSHIPLVMFGLAKRAAIDVRLVSTTLPDDPNSKLNESVRQIVADLNSTKDYNGTIAVFCDSYQSSNKKFNVFDDVKNKLVKAGIPIEQIAIVNDYKEGPSREQLFKRVNSGEVRVIMGTTERLGVGVNIQERLHALVHLDAPIRPSDYQQRNGRIARQGNMHLDMGKTIKILRIGVEQTLDVTGYQRLEIKKRFIDQIMKGDTSERMMEEEDLDTSNSNNFGEMMASLSGSQAALALSVENNKLRKLENALEYHLDNQAFMQNTIEKGDFALGGYRSWIKEYEAQKRELHELFPDKKVVSLTVGNQTVPAEEAKAFIEKTVGKAIEAEVEKLRKDVNSFESSVSTKFSVNGVKFTAKASIIRKLDLDTHKSRIMKAIWYTCDSLPNLREDVGAKASSIIDSLESILPGEHLDRSIENYELEIDKTKRTVETYRGLVGKPFAKQAELEAARKRVIELESKMEKELAELDAKERAEDIEVIDVTDYINKDEDGPVSDEEDNGVRFRDSDGGVTEAQVVEKDVVSLSETMNTPVRMVRDVNEITHKDKATEKRMRASKGWYDTNTGEVVVVLPNAKSVADAQATVLHEAVGHMGLRKLLGRDFNATMSSIYDSLPKDVQKSLMDKYGSKLVAAEEYASEMAETLSDPGIVQRIASAFKQAMRKLGINLKMTDGDIMTLLWKSKNRLTGGDSAADIVRKMGKEDKVKSEARVFDRVFRDGTLAEAIEEISNDPIIKQRMHAAVKSRSFQLQEGYQDRMLAVKKMQQFLEEQKLTKLPDYMNVYMFENTLSSRNTYEIEQYNENYYNPMMESITAIIKNGETLRNVEDYAIAKHGIERNDLFRLNALKAEIDNLAKNNAYLEWLPDDVRSDSKKFQERVEGDKQMLLDEIGEGKFSDIEGLSIEPFESLRKKLGEKDYAGLTALEAEYDAPASEIVKSFESRNERYIDGLWKSINKATKASLKKWFDSGMITKDTFNKINGMYSHYVPLRGFAEETASDVYEYFTEQESAFNSPLRKAYGRKSKPETPFAHILSMAGSSIVGGNKNIMKLHLLRLAQAHPSDYMTADKTWYVDNGKVDPETGKPMYDPVFPEYSEDINTYRENLEQFEMEMNELSEQGIAFKGVKKLKPGYKISKIESSEHMVRAVLNGEEYHILVHGDPRVAQAVNGINDKGRQESAFMKKIAWANRQMAANFTTRNPAFIASNLVRDVIFASTALSIKEGSSYTMKFEKNIFGGAGGALKRFLQGKPDMSKQEDVYLKEFLENGGETGHTALYNIDKYKKMVEKDARQGKKADARKKYMSVIDFFANGARWAEDLSRFSVYMASRQSGRSVLRSVSDAKEVTVNFNRKGSGSYGAGYARAAYLFFNAAVQSLSNAAVLMKDNPVKGTAALMSYASVGVLIPAIIASLGDDDDLERYNNLPDYVRKNHLCIPVGDMFVKIPLPIELRAFYGLGDQMYRTLSGLDGMGESLSNIALSFMDLLPINPSGGGDVLGNILPDATVPFYESYYSNKDFTGKPIAKITPFNEFDPEYKRVDKSANAVPVYVSQFLNSVTGGDEVKRGVYDKALGRFANPASFEHLFGSYFGGLWTTLNHVYKSTENAVKATVQEDFDAGENQVWRTAPILNRFVDEGTFNGSLGKVNERYFKAVREMRETKHLIKGYEDKLGEQLTASEAAKIAAKISDIMKGNEAKRMYIIEDYSKEIQSLSKESENASRDRKIQVNDRINELKERMLEKLKEY